MNFLDYLQIALRAIRSNPLRSALTALGVVIGVASVVALVALGQGAGVQIARQIQGLGTNLIIIATQIPPNGGTQNPNNLGGPPQLFPDDADILKDGLEGTGAVVVPVMTAQTPIKIGSKVTSANVVGTWPVYAQVRGLQISNGRFLREGGEDAPSNEVVLGSDAAYRLFGRLDPVGRTVFIKDFLYKVVGVVAPKGYEGFQNVDQNVYLTMVTTEAQVLISDVVNYIYVQAPSAEALPQLEQTITKLLAEAHSITDPEQYDFSVRSQSALLNTARGTLNIITTLLSGIALVSLLVGGIGIMNIMLVSVTERTREVGIRVALGALPRDIVIQFITEALILSSLGGLLGILGGIAVARVISTFAGWETVISASVVGIAFFFSLAVGVFFGWYPAFLAARLDPIKALRYE
ncbi:ABC transporter permease [uncultured Meiothermus sp.]|uniref:ABC transporter permease n=1 Tax=uncultured Meiothermus sp. TaxID=157471 RepID=UPI002606A158|nr:ABC transporter permease [uncultured Meiothermus sp.]